MTVFIGPNNSGKSSIFHAFLTLRQAVGRGSVNLLNPVLRQPTNTEQLYLYPSGQEIDPGPFDSLVRKGQGSIEIEFRGSFQDQDATLGGLRKVTILVGLGRNQLTHHRGQIEYEIGGSGRFEGFNWDWVRGMDRLHISPGGANLRGIALTFEPVESFDFLTPGGFTSPPNFPQHELAEISAFLTRISRAPAAFLKSLHPVYPLRGLEESAYPLPDDAATNSDRMMLADRTLALLSILAYKPEIEEQVSMWIGGLLGLRLKHRLITGKRVAIVAEPVGRHSPENLFVNEGTGAGQLPFILVPIALCPSGETVMISEPEVHLHPRAQSELARLFVRIAVEEKKQFILETHSEHVLNSLLHAVAKGDLNKADLTIYYFESRADATEVRRLVVDDYGRVEGGLPGFFDQSLTELTEYLETLKKK